MPFLGRNLADLPVEGGRAYVQHNRDVGILTDDALVTLGLQREVNCYRRSGRQSDSFAKSSCADHELAGLVNDATAVYQTAADMLKAGTFALAPSEPSSVREANVPPVRRRHTPA